MPFFIETEIDTKITDKYTTELIISHLNNQDGLIAINPLC